MKRRYRFGVPSRVRSAAPGLDLTRRSLLVALPAVSATACIGSFPLTNRMLEWNMNIHESKWVNWIVFFLLFAIVPAYGIVFGIVDAIVLNSIEFWTGDTLLAEKTLDDGTVVATEATDDPDVARMQVTSREGEILAVYFVHRTDDEIRVSDEHGATLAHVGNAGRPTLRDARGRRVARLEREHVRRVLAAGRAGSSMAEAAWDCLEASGQDAPMLAFGATLGRRATI